MGYTRRYTPLCDRIAINKLDQWYFTVFISKCQSRVINFHILSALNTPTPTQKADFSCSCYYRPSNVSPLTTIPFFLKSLINKMSVKGLFNSQSFHSKIWSIQFVTSLLKSAKSSLLITPAFIRLRISTKKSLRLISIATPGDLTS